MAHHDFEEGAAREDFCRFLAACYYQPDPAFAEERMFDSMLEAATRIHPALAAQVRQLGEEFSRESIESLLIDYTSLFLGSPQAVAPPYGSVWLEDGKIVMGDTTMAVLALYEEGGFEIDEEFRGPPDHIAAELEFLYLLINRQNEGHRTGDPQALEAASGLKKRFLREQLGLWIGPFTAAVKVGAQRGFYRQLAELTDRFVKMEARGDKSP